MNIKDERFNIFFDESKKKSFRKGDENLSNTFPYDNSNNFYLKMYP